MGIINPNSNTIYDLALHDEIQADDLLYVRRVPNGWIYSEYHDVEAGKIVTSVFVPYSDEFNSADTC